MVRIISINLVLRRERSDRLEGRPQERSCPRPSFETAAMQPPQDEACGFKLRPSDPIGFTESLAQFIRSTRNGRSRLLVDVSGLSPSNRRHDQPFTAAGALGAGRA